MKKINILTMAIALVATGATRAQEPEIDLAARERSIPIIETRINARNNVIVQTGNDILQLHKRIDDELSGMVDRLAAIKDSARSGRRVGKLKMEMNDELRQAVDIFQSKRAELAKNLLEGETGIPNQIIKNEIHHFDAHIEKHIEEMLKISKSFTQDKDVDKYKRLSGDGGGGGGGYSGYYGGWFDEPIEISDAWIQNLASRDTDKKQKDDVVAALKKSMDRCELRIRYLRSGLQEKGLTEIDRKVIQSELDAHLSMLEKRRTQVEDLLVVPRPDTREVSREVAEDLQDAVRELIDDVQRNVRMISVKHTQLHDEEANVAKLTTNLEARKKWLEDYKKKSGK